MQVIIRADASQKIGSGHIMRCLTLAEGLKSRGAEVQFVTRAHHGHLAKLIEHRGFKTHLLPKSATSDWHSDNTSEHGAWIGDSWQHDVTQTSEVIGRCNFKPEWLIVDHYGIDQQWETAMRDSAEHVLVIDDLADRMHDCDILLDQNIPTNLHSNYDSLLNADAIRLLGPQYILLRPEFEASAQYTIEPHHQEGLIFFGGMDSSGMTLQAIEALHASGFGGNLHILVGKGNPHSKAILQRCTALGYNCHQSVSNVAQIIQKTSFAIVACGFIVYELMALKVPSLLVPLSNIQAIVAKRFEELNMARIICSEEIGETETFSARLEEVLSLTRSEPAFELISVDGVENVIEEMMGFRDSEQ